MAGFDGGASDLRAGYIKAVLHRRMENPDTCSKPGKV